MTTKTGMGLLSERAPRMPKRCEADVETLREGAASLGETMTSALQTDTMVECVGVTREAGEPRDVDHQGTIETDGRAIGYALGEGDAAAMAGAVFGAPVEGMLVGRVAEAIMRAGITPLAMALGANQPPSPDADAEAPGTRAPRLRADYKAGWQGPEGAVEAAFSLSCKAAAGADIAATALSAVTVPADATLGHAVLSIGQVKALAPGQTFALSEGGLERIGINVGGAPYARGEMGKAAGKRTVRLIA